VIIISDLNLNITFASLTWSLIFIVNAVLISTALHILILCLGVVALEVNSAIWLYRDLSRLGQFPIVIYTELIRFVLNFVVPIGIMVGLPAQLLFGGKPSVPLATASLLGVVFFIGSLWVWKKSLKKYSSASS
jgi:ABC-2 type transport system permease protein